jgi:hypothetical protein
VGAARPAGWIVDAGEDVHDRLSDMIDRFTVLSQKKAGSAVTRVVVEEGDAGGTLTLF